MAGTLNKGSLVKGTGGSGGGGSTDYADLSNKPSINSVSLSGNKTSADLSLVSAPTVLADQSTSDMALKGNTIY